jgi:predicted DNA-binding protein with PD1-like motif
MKYSQASPGRVFVLRLEDGDVIHEQIERFALMENLDYAAVIAVGGIDKDSTLVVGPKDGRAQPVTAMEHVIDNVHEVSATGTIFPNEQGTPVLHMHLSAGRKTSTVTGCVRKGVKVWVVLEVIIFELVGSTARRVRDAQTGFELLQP